MNLMNLTNLCMTSVWTLEQMFVSSVGVHTLYHATVNHTTINHSTFTPCFKKTVKIVFLITLLNFHQHW